jgi:hypothetical protein
MKISEFLKFLPSQSSVKSKNWKERKCLAYLNYARNEQSLTNSEN